MKKMHTRRSFLAQSALAVGALAAPLLLTGLMLQMGWSLASVKVVMILVFLMATNPTASHAMAKAAHHGRYRPLLQGEVVPPGRVPSKS